MGPISETKGYMRNTKNINKEIEKYYRRKMKKIGFIVLAVVLALGLVGAAFAAWNQNLYVQAKVQTGTLSAVIDVASGYEASAVPSYVSVIDSTSAPWTTLLVTVTNAVPGAVISVPYEITNNGTIPCNIAWVPGASDMTNFTNYTDNNGWAGTTDLAVGGHYIGTITFTVADGVIQGTSYSTYLTIAVTQGS